MFVYLNYPKVKINATLIDAFYLPDTFEFTDKGFAKVLTRYFKF